MLYGMWTSIVALASSKRFIVAVSAILVDAAIMFGLDVSPENAEAFTSLIAGLAGVVVLGISISDHGKALGQPQGVDHKGNS